MNESSLFWIKAGDSRPVIRAVLRDRAGVPVPLGGCDVSFALRERDGTLVIEGAADAIDDPNNGIVQYTWAPGDTDRSGDFLGQWSVVFPDGSLQTFPTSGYNTVSISSSTAANFNIIAEVRRKAGETGETLFTDNEILEMFSGRDNSVDATVYDVWMAKAAEYAQWVDVTESSSSRPMSSLYKNAVEMADRYYKLAGLGNAPESGASAFVRPVTRA